MNEHDEDEQLPPKPPLDIPTEDVAPPTDQEEQEAGEDEPLSDEDAAEDDTVDNEESEEQPWAPENLPEGASAADYDNEEQT